MLEKSCWRIFQEKQTLKAHIFQFKDKNLEALETFATSLLLVQTLQSSSIDNKWTLEKLKIKTNTS